MPPVREPSTKPSAATVLPAPVACSNQKRLPAFGSSGASGSCSSSSAPRRARPPSPAAPPARPRRRAPPRRGCPARRAAPRPRRPRDAVGDPLPFPDSASSAVSVPDSASTWWAESTVPSTSFGSSWLSSRSRPSRSDQRWRHATDGTLAPASSSASAASSARRRAVPGASATAASSPSSTNGSRVNAAARSIASSEGVAGAASAATDVDSAIRLGGDDRVREPRPTAARPRGFAGRDPRPGRGESRTASRIGAPRVPSIEAECAERIPSHVPPYGA